MTTVFDVPSMELIEKVAGILEKNENIVPPKWAENVKTGIHKELPPNNDNWWYIRCAAVLRKIYTDGPVGIERLRSVYGGKKDNGSSSSHKAKGSGSIVRKAVQQLESCRLPAKGKRRKNSICKGTFNA